MMASLTTMLAKNTAANAKEKSSSMISKKGSVLKRVTTKKSGAFSDKDGSGSKKDKTNADLGKPKEPKRPFYEPQKLKDRDGMIEFSDDEDLDADRTKSRISLHSPTSLDEKQVKL